MNGHDEDKNVNSGAPQGIFSTPELTVDANKIAQPDSAVFEASRAKIASIFANTKTGRQSQQLNEAMIANTAPATEDIVINNGPKKRSKWPIVLMMVVLIAVVGGVVGYFAISSLQGQQTATVTPREAFGGYVEYVKRGPEDLRDRLGGVLAGDEWFFFRVNESVFSDSERKQYFETVLSRYDFFENSITSRNSSEIETVANELAKYKPVLASLIVSMSLNIAAQDVLETYVNRGASAAYKYIEEFAPEYGKQELTEYLNAASRTFLDTDLSIIEIYDGWGCIVDGSLDTLCGDSFSDRNEAFVELSERRRSAVRSVKYYADLLHQDFTQMTDMIQKLLEEKNE